MEVVEVLQVLIGDLSQARRSGQPFAVAWTAAATHALTVVGPALERQAWQEALTGTRATWARCYRGGQATPSDVALERLVGALVAERDGFRRHGQLVA